MTVHLLQSDGSIGGAALTAVGLALLDNGASVRWSHSQSFTCLFYNVGSVDVNLGRGNISMLTMPHFVRPYLFLWKILYRQRIQLCAALVPPGFGRWEAYFFFYVLLLGNSFDMSLKSAILICFRKFRSVDREKLP